MDTLVVCNLALVNIGMSPITQVQLTADTIPSAKYCNLYFDVDRDDVLEETNWSFAKVKRLLTKSDVIGPKSTDTVQIPDWTLYYDYPSNCMTMWYVYNEATIDDKANHDFEEIYDPDYSSYFIGSNLDTAFGEFTYKVTDPSKWDSKFIKAFSWKLASSIAPFLTADAGVAKDAASTYQGLIDEAKRINGQENRKKQDRKSSTQQAR